MTDAAATSAGAGAIAHLGPAIGFDNAVDVVNAVCRAFGRSTGTECRHARPKSSRRLHRDDGGDVGITITGAHDGPGPEVGVLDLSAVTRFDSSALAVLFELNRRLAPAGRRLELRHVPDGLHDLARLYGVDGLLFDTPSR